MPVWGFQRISHKIHQDFGTKIGVADELPVHYRGGPEG
jgi:hypothetical protein